GQTDKTLSYAKDYYVYDGNVWDFDNATAGNVSVGLLSSHTVEQHDDSGVLLDRFKTFDATYDNAANLTTMMQPRDAAHSRTTTLEYDLFGLPVTHSHIDATGTPSLDAYNTIDPISLAMLSTTDANGTQRGTTYDGFGRPIASTITPPGGTAGTLVSYAYSGFLNSTPPTKRSIQAKVFTDPVANASTAP